MIDLPATINIGGIDFYIDRAETKIEYNERHEFLDGSRNNPVASLLYVNLRLVCTASDMKKQMEKMRPEQQQVIRRKFNLEEL